MKAIARFAATMGVCMGLAGCGNFMAVHRQFNPTEGESISIDAKQRVIYSFAQKGADGKPSTYVLCAEPSPDALSALSAGSGLSLETLKVALSGTFTTQEGAASIGLRTQTIQILRDAMYRLCEGYASGALDTFSFERLQRKYQNNMLGLLAIEQLTGTVAARQVAMTGRAESTVSRSLLEMTRALDEMKARRVVATEAVASGTLAKESADKEFTDAQTAYNAALAAAGNDAAAAAVVKVKTEKLDPATKKKAEATAELARKTVALNDIKESIASLEKAISDAGKVNSSAFMAAAFEPVPVSAMANEKTAAVISQSVVSIVEKLVDHDYTREICIDALVGVSRTDRSSDRMKAIGAACSLKAASENERLAGRLKEVAGTPEQTRLEDRIRLNNQAIQSFGALGK